MKPETRIKNAVNDRTEKLGVYDQGMFTPYSNGTPDHYYEGNLDCLWIEYKHVKKLSASTDPFKLCSGLQRLWINRVRANGKHAWVVVGDDKREYAVWRNQWDTGRPDHIVDKEGLALMIYGQVGVDHGKAERDKAREVAKAERARKVPGAPKTTKSVRRPRTARESTGDIGRLKPGALLAVGNGRRKVRSSAED